MTKQGLSYAFFDHWFKNWGAKVMVLFTDLNITILVLLSVNDNLLALIHWTFSFKSYWCVY